MKNIRDVRPRDLRKVLRLEREVFGQDAFSKELIKKLIFNNTFFLILYEGSLRKNLLGFIIGIKDRKDRMNIINFLIAPKYQLKGNGSFLLEKAIDITKDLKKVKKIILNVKTDNEIAIALYERFNFHIVKKIEGYYSSGDDGFLMERDS